MRHVVTTPSSLRRRLPAALVAVAGFGTAVYLGLYQDGSLRSVWEPLFGTGSAAVLHSSLARALPVPDAFLGALAYLVEFVLELWGDESRWQSRPLLTGANMALVAAMALGSLGLVAAQGLVFRAWCTLCLVSACCSFAIFGLAWPEMRAMVTRVARTGST